MQLWLTHGCGLASLYGGDGEMRCNCAPFIDFKRDSEADILAGVAEHAARRQLQAVELALEACGAAHEKWRELHPNAALTPVGAINACVLAYLQSRAAKDVRRKNE